MIQHPLAVAFAEHFLGPTCLLSACLSINLHPGETVQPWHTDDGHIQCLSPMASLAFPYSGRSMIPRGERRTEILPYSHRWDSHEIDGRLDNAHFAQRDDLDGSVEENSAAVKATMSAGPS